MFFRINADRVINTKNYDAGFLVVPTEDDETPRGFKLCAMRNQTQMMLALM